MRLPATFRALLAALCCTTLAFGAFADVSGAQTFVEREHGRIKQLVEKSAPTAELNKAIDAMVDYQAISERALGKPCPATLPACTNHWDELTAAQKAEVSELFKALVAKKYRENANKTKDFEVTYRGTKEQAPDVTKVRTEAKNKVKPREPAVQVDYLVRSEGSTYKVIDLITEGSVLSKNYYDQSHKMLTTQGQGYPYFVKKLREKINK